MTIFIAIVLGLMQGLTEFFPISSSAHLQLTEHLFGLKSTPLSFYLSCHLGTLFALLWFLRSDLKSLFFKERNQIPYFFLALIPLIPAYFFLKPLRDWASDPKFLGYSLMLTGLILYFGQKIRFQTKNAKWRDVMWIGAMQTTALIPGISRSGVTISAARCLGWDPKRAVRFSFLLAVPTIVGGTALELLKETANVFNLYAFAGFSSSFLSGVCVVGFAMRFLEKGNLKIFAIYCLLLGIALKTVL